MLTIHDVHLEAKIVEIHSRIPSLLVGGLEHQFYFPIYWE